MTTQDHDLRSYDLTILRSYDLTILRLTTYDLRLLARYSIGEQAQDLEHQVGRDKRGSAHGIERRRHLHHVGADEIDTTQAAQHALRLGLHRVRFGSSLARQLTEAGHTVAVIDRKPEAFERLGADFAGQKIVGIGFDRDRLIEAGIERAGALASVTNGDNSNILIARVARETFGIERVVARIYDPRRAAIYQRLGIATVATVAWATERVLRRIVTDVAAVEWVDPSANVSLVEKEVDRAFAGKRLMELEETNAGLRIMAVSRLGVAQMPTPSLVAQEGDVLYLAVDSDALARLDSVFAAPKGGH